jgi:hypothetical protein
VQKRVSAFVKHTIFEQYTGTIYQYMFVPGIFRQNFPFFPALFKSDQSIFVHPSNPKERKSAGRFYAPSKKSSEPLSQSGPERSSTESSELERGVQTSGNRCHALVRHTVLRIPDTVQLTCGTQFLISCVPGVPCSLQIQQSMCRRRHLGGQYAKYACKHNLFRPGCNTRGGQRTFEVRDNGRYYAKNSTFNRQNVFCCCLCRPSRGCLHS